MKRTFQALLFALVAITMPIGAWAQEVIALPMRTESSSTPSRQGTTARRHLLLFPTVSESRLTIHSGQWRIDHF